jgi:hypothetical protein
MPGVYVGDTKCLVFPMMCDGYIKQEYLNTNPANTDLELREGHWGVDEFTIEAIITPYDVNGYGVKTGSGSGITDSEKTAPSLAQAVSSNLTSYQSYQYFGASHGTVPRLTHKMMLYWNKNFELYLENTTLSNVNQPAEYKIVAKIHQDDVTKGTVETEAIIKANNMLHGYYDETGLYNGITTSLRKLDDAVVDQSNTSIIELDTATNVNKIGIGTEIFDNTGASKGKVNSINSIAGTLTMNTAQGQGNSSYVAYYSQPKEALYIESTYKISCSYSKGALTLYVNGNKVASTTTTLSGYYFHPSDSWIGKGKVRTSEVIGGTTVYTYSENKYTQFMGEIYEVCMHKRKEPSLGSTTLSPGYSDILFYYRFGDE